MEPQPSIVNNLMRKLPIIEMILLAILGCGLLAHYLEVSQAGSLVTLALGGLAGIFFLSAYIPPEKKQTAQTDVKSGLADLLFATILPKILWLSCAICALGLLFFQMDTDNDGYKMMLMIHSVITPGAVILVGLGSVRGVQGASLLFPVLIRAVSLFIVAAYLIRAEITGLFGG